jgi:hypothetical protein
MSKPRSAGNVIASIQMDILTPLNDRLHFIEWFYVID